MLESYSIFPPDISSTANFLQCSRAHELVRHSGKLFGMRVTMTRGTRRGFGLQKRSALSSIHPAETAVEHNSAGNTAPRCHFLFPMIFCSAFTHLYQSHHINVSHEGSSHQSGEFKVIQRQYQRIHFSPISHHQTY